MNHIDETTYLQLINAVEQLSAEIQAVAAETGCPPNYRRLAVVAKAVELARVARAQARAAGVMVEVGR